MDPRPASLFLTSFKEQSVHRSHKFSGHPFSGRLASASQMLQKYLVMTFVFSFCSFFLFCTYISICCIFVWSILVWLKYPGNTFTSCIFSTFLYFFCVMICVFIYTYSSFFVLLYGWASHQKCPDATFLSRCPDPNMSEGANMKIVGMKIRLSPSLERQ